MTITSKTNQRYQTGNNQSVFSLKENSNKFLKDLSVLEQKNRIDNGYFNSVYRTLGMPGYWETYLVSSFLYDTTAKTSFTTIAASGYYRQKIKNLRPNEEYTAFVYCTSPAASALQLSIYSVGTTGQIFNINDATELNKASSLISVASSALSKTIIQFRTNSTSVSGDIYVELKNVSVSARDLTIQKIVVYKGLIEIDDVMDPDAFDPTPERSFLLEDSLSWDCYEYFIYKGSMIQYLIDPNVWEKKKSVVLKDSASASSYTLRSLNGGFNLDQDHTYMSTAATSTTINDVANGLKYSLSVSSGSLVFTPSLYTTSEYVVADRTNGSNKFFLEVVNEALSAAPTSGAASGTTPSGFFIRSTNEENSYSLCVSGSNIVLEPVTYDQNMSFYKNVKDFSNNYVYRAYVESGAIRLLYIGVDGYTPLRVYNKFIGPTFGNTVINSINAVSGIPALDINAAGMGGHESNWYAPLDSPAFSGVPLVPTPLPGDNSGQVVNTNYIKSSVALAGTPTTPTPPLGVSSQQVTNTEWVLSAISNASLNTDTVAGPPMQIASVTMPGAGTFSNVTPFNIQDAPSTNAVFTYQTSSPLRGRYLEVFLNGVRLTEGQDYDEIGVGSGTTTTQNTIQWKNSFAYATGDVFIFKTANQGIQGVQGIQGIQGIQGPTGPLAGVGNVFVSTFTNDLNMAQNGHQRFPGGLVLQWGLAGPFVGNNTINRVSFTQSMSGVVNIQATPVGAAYVGAGDKRDSHYIYSLDSYGFDIRVNYEQGGNYSFFWMAIGW